MSKTDVSICFIHRTNVDLVKCGCWWYCWCLRNPMFGSLSHYLRWILWPPQGGYFGFLKHQQYLLFPNPQKMLNSSCVTKLSKNMNPGDPRLSPSLPTRDVFLLMHEDGLRQKRLMNNNNRLSHNNNLTMTPIQRMRCYSREIGKNTIDLYSLGIRLHTLSDDGVYNRLRNAKVFRFHETTLRRWARIHRDLCYEKNRPYDSLWSNPHITG